MKNLQFTPLMLLIDPASSNLSTAAALQLVLLTPDRLTSCAMELRIVMFHHRQNGLIVDRLLLLRPLFAWIASLHTAEHFDPDIA